MVCPGIIQYRPFQKPGHGPWQPERQPWTNIGLPHSLRVSLNSHQKLPGWSSRKNDSNPESIGKYISALSNAARLEDKPFAYMLWGIRDTDHGITGTTFSATSARHKGQPLEHWLTQFVSPSLNFTFRSVNYHGIHLTLLEIPACESMPTEFDRIAYIRIGSATPKLSDHQAS